MTARYLRVSEVCGRLAIDDAFVRLVCDEGLVEIKSTVDEEPVISAEDAERLRLISVLVHDLDVNLAGVEVILHMRDDLYSRQRQYDEIVRVLVDELRRRMTARG